MLLEVLKTVDSKVQSENKRENSQNINCVLEPCEQKSWKVTIDNDPHEK